MRHGVIVGATLILAAACTLLLIARATGGASAVRTRLAALAPVAALVALGATALAASVTWWLAVLVAIPTAVLVRWQVPPRRPKSPGRALEASSATAGSQSVTLRFLTLNALVGRASPAAIVSQLRRLTPDVLAVQELTPELAKSLAEEDLADVLPFSYLDPRPSSSGIGLWSRWPITQLPPVPGSQSAMPRAELSLGWPVTVTLVHTSAPIRGGEHAWQHDMDRLLSALTDTTGQQLVAGDFNASRDHRAFRKLLAAQFVDCADAARHRPWPGFTWPANRRLPPIIRLDHILVSRPGAVVHQVRTIEIPGTDHRAVFAVIELQASRSADSASSG